MLLSTIFEALTYGEFAQLGLTDDEGDGIKSDKYGAVISHINLALAEIYKRFPLREIDIPFTEATGTNLYVIPGDHVLKIESLTDADGEEIPLNKLSDETSYFTPVYNTIRVPEPTQDKVVTVKCRAAHDLIVNAADLDPTTITVNVPYTLFEALLFYAASRAHASTASFEGTKESFDYLAKFEASVRKVSELDLVNKPDTENENFDNDGWV